MFRPFAVQVESYRFQSVYYVTVLRAKLEKLTDKRFQSDKPNPKRFEIISLIVRATLS